MEEFMKVNGYRIKEMDMALRSLATEIFIRENITREKFMDKERWFGVRLKSSMMDNGLKD